MRDANRTLCPCRSSKGLAASLKEEGTVTPVLTMKKMAAYFRHFAVRATAGASMLLVGLTGLAGCGSNSSPSSVHVGSITFTDVNGTALKTQPQTIAAGQGTYVDVQITGDPQLLGADWSVYCGSALPPGTPPPPGESEDESCGTFTPGHTMSAPIPTYLTSATGYVALYVAPTATPKNGIVTLYAVSTSNPAKFSSVSLSIGGQPISVELAPAPPLTMQASATTVLRAVVDNDTTNAGVSWTALCVSTSCGSFDPGQTSSAETTTYTAPPSIPSGGTVQVTATSLADPTKTASATITIQQ